MINPRFFNKKLESLTLEEVINLTGAKLANESYLKMTITDVATLHNAESHHISFLNSGQYLDKFLTSKAGFCLMQQKNADKVPNGMVALIHENPYFCYSQIADAFYEVKNSEFGDNLIDSSAQIGEGAKIAPNVFIGKDVVIGKNCTIYPGATILNNCVIGDNCTINSNSTISFSTIGNNCTIFSGARIGQDGFGFAHDSGINHKIIQLGSVIIGDDVEVGANTCIDRGAIENTIIGNGVKLDNLVQVAHNVIIDQGTVIAGCSAIAGSTKIGKFVQIGGNSSVSGHLTVGDGAKIAGMSGVARDVEPMQAVAGIPSVPIRKWHKANAMMAKMTESKNNKTS